MTFKDLINETILFEKAEKIAKNGLKIFYSVDIKVTKQTEEEKAKEAENSPTSANQNLPQQADPNVAAEIPADPNAGAEIPADPNAEIPQEVPVDPNAEIPTEIPPVDPNAEAPKVSLKTKRNITEEKEEEETDKKIEIEADGIISLTEGEIDRIQTIDDIIDLMADKKDKKTKEKLFDEFVLEVVRAILSPTGIQEVAKMISIKDYIYIDIDFGNKKDDSIGIRIIKRKSSDGISITLKKDSSLQPSKFNVDRLNDQILEMRNTALNKGSN